MKKNVWIKLVSLAMLAIALWLVGWDTPVKLAIGALIAIAWQLMFSVHKSEITALQLKYDSMRDARDSLEEHHRALGKRFERFRSEYEALQKGKAEERVPVDMTNLVDGIAYHILEFNRGAEVKLKPVGVTMNGALAAKFMDRGFRAEMVPVWILPDGRMAWRKSGRNSLEISIIRPLENAQ